MGLDRKEYGGKMGVVLDDVLGVGGLKGADTDVETSVLWAVAVICQRKKQYQKEIMLKFRLITRREGKTLVRA